FPLRQLLREEVTGHTLPSLIEALSNVDYAGLENYSLKQFNEIENYAS
ncbi:27630_t:CDS:2, partial [Dentiscutata erythropus]